MTNRKLCHISCLSRVFNLWMVTHMEIAATFFGMDTEAINVDYKT